MLVRRAGCCATIRANSARLGLWAGRAGGERADGAGAHRPAAPGAIIDVIDTLPLRDARILLLEDDALISLDTEEMLRALGARRVVVAHTLEAAEAAVRREAIDAAVLDIAIGPDRCDGFARMLLERAVPFVFATGYGDRAALPQDLRQVPKVVKPYGGAALLAALAAAGAVP